MICITNLYYCKDSYTVLCLFWRCVLLRRKADCLAAMKPRTQYMMDDQCKWSLSLIPNTFCQKWVLAETSDNQSETVKIHVKFAVSLPHQTIMRFTPNLSKNTAWTKSCCILQQLSKFAEKKRHLTHFHIWFLQASPSVYSTLIYIWIVMIIYKDLVVQKLSELITHITNLLSILWCQNLDQSVTQTCVLLSD